MAEFMRLFSPQHSNMVDLGGFGRWILAVPQPPDRERQRPTMLGGEGGLRLILARFYLTAQASKKIQAGFFRILAIYPSLRANGFSGFSRLLKRVKKLRWIFQDFYILLVAQKKKKKKNGNFKKLNSTSKAGFGAFPYTSLRANPFLGF